MKKNLDFYCFVTSKRNKQKNLREKIIFFCRLEGHRRKEQDPDPDPLVKSMVPGSENPDPDPYQNVTDPDHWFKGKPYTEYRYC
jgi:hypothetical protein